MTLRLRLTSRAVREVRTIAAWWRKNRLAAPHLFEKEMDAALEGLLAAPESGQPYEVPGARPVRRVLLRRCRYHLYYEVDEGKGELIVLTVWHTSRRAPRLV